MIRGPVCCPELSAAGPRPLKVSDDRRFLVYGRWQAVLLAGRHRLGAVPPPESRRGRPLPREPRRARLHRHPGGGHRRARRPQRAQSLRPPAAGGPRSRPPGREGRARPTTTGTTSTTSSTRPTRCGIYDRLPADLGPLLARQDQGRQAAVHAGQRRDLRRVAGPPLQGSPGVDLDSRRRPPDRQRRRSGRSSAPWPAACARATAART